MKKVLSAWLAAILLVTLLATLLCLPVCAEGEGYELLENGDFSEEPGFTWLPYVASSVSFTDEGREGSAIKVEGRTHYTDIVRQYVTTKLSYYGAGTYELTAYVRLADEGAAPVDVQAVLGIYGKDGQKRWQTTSFAQVTADAWTMLKAQVNVSWTGELEQAEFYFITRDGQENGDYRNLLIDDCSLKTVSYVGEEYGSRVETEAPETAAPETQAPETVAPETQAPETAAPETSAPEAESHDIETEAPRPTETDPEAVTDPPSPSPDKGSKQSMVIGGMLIAVGVILAACGVALTITYVKGGKQA